jgi:hypothetical protein
MNRPNGSSPVRVITALRRPYRAAATATLLALPPSHLPKEVTSSSPPRLQRVQVHADAAHGQHLEARRRRSLPRHGHGPPARGTGLHRVASWWSSRQCWQRAVRVPAAWQSAVLSFYAAVRHGQELSGHIYVLIC